MRGSRTRLAAIWVGLIGVAASSFGQPGGDAWTLVKDGDRTRITSRRTPIIKPEGAGFAVFKVQYRVGGEPSLYVMVELASSLRPFPFERYAGPVDKTKEEYIEFAAEPASAGIKSTVRVAPVNGSYVAPPSGAFEFTTYDSEPLMLLSQVRDGQRLTVTVNGRPASILVAFDTTGLKRLLEQMDLRSILRTAPGKTGAKAVPTLR